MKARMLATVGRRACPYAIVLSVAVASGCSTMARKHEANRIPQYGVIDPHQPRELHKSPYPPYVIEPPDELEIAIRPPLPDGTPPTFVVQPDGFVDLGFAGDVFLAGLTLGDAEERIALQLTEQWKANGGDSDADRRNQKYEVSVRLANNQSKFYYVMGSVGNQGRFKCTGNETVLDAILQAGLRSNSLPDKAYVSRPHPAGGPDCILKIDWFGIRDRGDTLTNYQLQPGDRVIVPGTKPPGVLGSLLGGG
jgi:polysaccharide export outer membrane protein